MPRDCTEPGLLAGDVQSRSSSASHTMTKKNANQGALVRYNPNNATYQPMSNGKPVQKRAPKGSKKKQEGRSQASIPQFLGANLNPFSAGSYGVRVPDDATAFTGTATGRDTLTYSTNAFGGAVAAFRFPASACRVVGTVTAAGTWTWPAGWGAATDVQNIAALRSNFSGCRTAAWGVRLSCPQSALNASGYVHIALVPEAFAAVTTWNYPTLLSDLEYATAYRKIPIAELIDEEVFVSGRFTDSTAFRYMDMDTTDANNYKGNFGTSGWMAIMVVVTGAQVSTANIMTAEYVAHYEALPDITNGNAGIISTEYSQSSPVTYSATSYALDNVPAIHKANDFNELVGQVGHLFNQGVKAVTNVAAAALPVVKFFL